MFNNIQKAIILGAGILVGGFFQSVHAEPPPPPPDDENIVISLQSNPMSDPERACLAVTFARMLSLNNTGDVTLFVTLDGVTLADESVVSSPRFKCDTPFADEAISLEENLDGFMKGDDTKMVVCPICWESRYGEGVENNPKIGTKMNPRTMIMAADKILDF